MGNPSSIYLIDQLQMNFFADNSKLT